MGEWGQINAGQPYNVLCTDIDRAIAHAGLTSYEQMIMQYVRERSWGVVRYKRRSEPWPDAEAVTINASELGREWGVARQRLQTAKTNLIDKRILIDWGDKYEINKNVAQWIGLSPKSFDYAKRAIFTTLKPGEESDSDQDISCTEKRAGANKHQDISCTEKCAGGARKSVQGVHGKVCTPDDIPPDPPIEERARQKSSEELRRASAPRACEPSPISNPSPAPDPRRLADRVVSEVFGLKEADGSPDANASMLIANWIRGASEQAVMGAALKAHNSARDPIPYFIGMCKRGLDEAAPGRSSPKAKPEKPPVYFTAEPGLKPLRPMKDLT